MKTIEELDQKLAEPSQKLVEDVSTLDGDILILGAGGKMGPSLAALAKNAVDESGKKRDVICVSRFSNPQHQEDLEKQGIKTIAADLMKEEDLQSLPEIKNVLYMVGFKFGSAENQSLSWAINSYLPGRVADKFKESSIVAFSTGNVYPLVDVKSGGATEAGGVGPVGEYAQSCLGRERVFEYFSRKNGTPLLNYRLNYAIDMRYGVLLEIAQNVYNGNPVDLRTGHANVIWQGDANEIAIRCLKHCSTPPTTLNVTGPETISIRWLAKEFAKRMKKEAEFVYEEEDTALLSNSTRCHQIFGYPSVSLLQMIEWTVEWVENEGKTIDKPTKFQERKGDF
jgi:nucleoside-diphosphate-sugar epimerase